MQTAHEQCGRDSDRRTKHDIQQQNKRAARRHRQRRKVRRDVERGPRAEENSADERRGAGRERHRQERVHADFGQHQFGREQHAANRRVERRSDALSHRHADQLSKCRAEGRADLDDRTFSTDRGAAANRQRRGQRLRHRHDRPDHAPVIVDRIHDLGHAVALCLGCEGADDEGHADPAYHRHEDDPRAPGRWRREQVRVVDERDLAKEQQVVHEPDQPAKHHRAKAGDDPYDQREPTHEQQVPGAVVVAPAGVPEREPPHGLDTPRFGGQFLCAHRGPFNAPDALS